MAGEVVYLPKNASSSITLECREYEVTNRHDFILFLAVKRINPNLR